MTDVLGWRRKFGVLGPSTNTIVQPDFEMMRPVGVTNHYSRILTPNAQAVSNDSFMAGDRGHRQERAGRRPQRHDLRAGLPGDGHVGRHVLRRRGGSRRAPSQGRERIRRRMSVGSACLHGGAAGLWRRQAHRLAVALLAGVNAEVRRYFGESGLRGGARRRPAMPELDRIAAVPPAAAQAIDRARWRRRRRHRPGRHQPAWSAWPPRPSYGSASLYRHQHGDLLACAAAERDHRQDPGARTSAGGVLTAFAGYCPSGIVRTTLVVGRASAVWPACALTMAASYCGSVFTLSFAFMCTTLRPLALSCSNSVGSATRSIAENRASG